MTTDTMPSVRQRVGFVATLLGLFMALLDIQIVASSLNEIQAGVAATPDEISWVQSAYLIAEVIMIPLAGVLTRMLSTRGAFLLSALGFTAASLGCALAQTLPQLVAMRALQGFLGGAMIPIAYAVSFGIFPKRVMGNVQAVMGLIATLAPSIGPTLGGYITDHLSWHWLFFVNLLPGVVAATGVWLCLDLDRAERGAFRRLDVAGLATLAVFLGSLEYVLEQGPRDDWFASGSILALAVIAMVAGFAFFARTLTAAHPIVDLRAFRNRNFAVGSTLGFLLGIVLYGMVYLMPVYFGTVRHFNSLQIGEVMFVTGAAMFFTAPIAGRASDKLDPRILLALGLALVGSGALLNARLTTLSGFHEFLWPQIVRGVGFMLCILPITRLALGTLPPAELSNSSGLFNVLRNLGGAFGLAGIDTALDIRFDYHWTQLIPAIDGARTVVAEQLAQVQGILMGAVENPVAASVKVLAQRVAAQAQALAFNDVFLWLGIAYVASVPLLLLLRRPAGAGPVASH
jgi:MFS transporter, DHA2 family, multidrug resistance protein